MPQVQIERKQDIAILRLNKGVTHLIGVEMVSELLKLVKEIPQKFRGMVLAGGQKFFSMGLDLPTLLPLNRRDIGQFIRDYNTACLELYTLPVPTACAICGHAVAGGHVLTLTCDFRVAADEKIKMGLNEICLGVPVPYLADMMQRQIIDDGFARQILYSGEWIRVEEALKMGLLDDVTAKDSVEEWALQMVLRRAAHPAHAYAAIKENRCEAICRKYEKWRDEKEKIFLDCWFHPETQKRMTEAAEKF